MNLLVMLFHFVQADEAVVPSTLAPGYRTGKLPGFRAVLSRMMTPEIRPSAGDKMAAFYCAIEMVVRSLIDQFICSRNQYVFPHRILF